MWHIWYAAYVNFYLLVSELIDLHFWDEVVVKVYLHTGYIIEILVTLFVILLIKR